MKLLHLSHFQVLHGLFFCLVVFSCTELESTEEDTGPEFSYDTKTVVDAFGIEFTYPVSFIESSRRHGLGIPSMLPEYRSPSVELFNKFRTDSIFSATIDGVDITQDELRSFDRSHFKAYVVHDLFHRNEEANYKVDLYSHQGYINLGEKWIQKSLEFRNMTSKNVENTTHNG